MYESTGWGEYPDERAQLPMGDVSTRTIAGLIYTPNLGPVGVGDSYFPGDTSQDARALHFLGFLDADVLFDHLNGSGEGGRGSTGTQAGDMDGEAGAWHPEFRDAVQRFQQAAGAPADGWIGPATRTRLLAAVTAKNASEMPSPLPIPPPPLPPGPNVEPFPPSPTPIPRPPGPQPVVQMSKSNTGRNVAIAIGAAVVLTVGYYALK